MTTRRHVGAEPSPRPRRRPGAAGLFRSALPLALALVVAAFPAPARCALVAGGATVRAEGRAPVIDGRVDLAFQRALEEAFRRATLETLRVIAPDRQSPDDLETWQETVLTRAVDFVAAWRVLAAEERDGFYVLEAEVEIWRDKLARAARAPRGAVAAPAVRLLVLADSFPLPDPAADEEVDGGHLAAAALEAELARRGAVIVATTDRAPWEQPSGQSTDESRVALASAAAKRLDADAVLVARLARAGAGLVLQAQLIAAASETTILSARADAALPEGVPLAEAFAPAARQLGAAIGPRLAAIRSGRARPAPP